MNSQQLNTEEFLTHLFKILNNVENANNDSDEILEKFVIIDRSEYLKGFNPTDGYRGLSSKDYERYKKANLMISISGNKINVIKSRY